MFIVFFPIAFYHGLQSSFLFLSSSCGTRLISSKKSTIVFIQVNGENIVRATHRRAVNVLKNAGNDILMFVIKAGMLNIEQVDIFVPDCIAGILRYDLTKLSWKYLLRCVFMRKLTLVRLQIIN